MKKITAFPSSAKSFLSMWFVQIEEQWCLNEIRGKVRTDFESRGTTTCHLEEAVPPKQTLLLYNVTVYY